MNLLCLFDFNQGDITARRGDVCEFAPIVAHRLLDSWPGCWGVAPDAPAPVETEAIDVPPIDKMIHAPARAKGKRRG